MKIEVILDTNVLVAGLRSRRGASYRLLLALAEGKLQLHLSVSLAFEYEAVLKRPGLIKAFSEIDIDSLLNYVLSLATLWPSVRSLRPVLRDPDDERILELAVRSGAAVITHNRRDFVGSEQFGVTVLSPAELVDLLRKRQL